MNKKESVSEEDYVYDVIVPIVNFHGVKRIKLLVEQTEGTEEGEIAKKICEAAKDCDMIVMSASQQRGRSNKHIGRVSEAVVHNATTPLLLWRDTEGMREEGMNDRSFREV
jgi:nucleotide-binding universal stress UspA family protein